jgi:hypothetical protein
MIKKPPRRRPSDRPQGHKSDKVLGRKPPKMITAGWARLWSWRCSGPRAVPVRKSLSSRVVAFGEFALISHGIVISRPGQLVRHRTLPCCLRSTQSRLERRCFRGHRFRRRAAFAGHKRGDLRCPYIATETPPTVAHANSRRLLRCRKQKIRETPGPSKHALHNPYPLGAEGDHLNCCAR